MVTYTPTRLEGRNGSGEVYDVGIADLGYVGLTLIETEFSATHVGTDVLAFEDAMVRLLN